MRTATDNEIIKALEEELKTALTINHRFEESNDTENPDDHKFITLLSNTIELFNRQKAEIERLNEQQRILICQLAEERDKAIKEFTGRLKEKKFAVNDLNEDIFYAVDVEDIDNLVKETEDASLQDFLEKYKIISSSYEMYTIKQKE